MSTWIQWRWAGRSRRMAGAALRVCVALLLVLQIVYTPIHLYRVPHSEETDLSVAAPLGAVTGFADHDDHDGDEHHGRHPASQHKFKVTHPTRAPLAAMAPVQPVHWAEADRDCPPQQGVCFSGLSPPELSRSWQFVFRAALPVRAPSLLS